MREKEEIRQLIESGKYFCINPWTHLHTEAWGTMTPCCLSKEEFGNLNEHSFKELWQGEAIRNLRLRMLRDEMVENCMVCYKNEEEGGISLRNLYNGISDQNVDWVANTDDNGYAPDAKPVCWDIRFSNICNLKCRTCSYYSSSSWYNDHKALGIEDPAGSSACGPDHVIGLSDSGKLINDIREFLPLVEYLYFAGGEPLLMKENLEIIKELNEMDKYDIRLTYNTNLTQIHKADKFFDYWAKVKNITFYVSLDGSHKRGEYIRKGIVWDKVISNLNLLKQKLPHAHIIIHYTVSALNILHLPDFHKEMVEKGYLDADKIILNKLYYPDMLSTAILPEEIKNEATDKIMEHISWIKQQLPFNSSNFINTPEYEGYFQQWSACIKHMNGEDSSHLIPMFVGATRRVDELRNENCLDVFPELEPIFRGK